MNLSTEEINRYSRHLMLKQVGTAGQLKLKSAKVLLIGAGGLGSPISLYLAAAGVGSIGIVDFDRVDISNLQRQILFRSHEVGQAKAAMAKQHLEQLNPHIDIKIYDERLDVDNARSLISQFDLVVDGSDNFETRYLVNDACFFENKPLIYGSIFQFEGQVSVFNVNNGPCYRCLFPSPPPVGVAPSCSQAGVIGVLPGMIGTIQANEAIKLILGIGYSLVGRLLMLDGLEMRFSEFFIKKNPACPLCSDQPAITKLQTEMFSCSVKFDVPEIMAEEFIAWKNQGKNFLLLDVRDPNEYELKNLGGYLIPLSELSQRIHELDKKACLLVHCASGKRSLQACQQLKEAGFAEVWNLAGGINAVSIHTNCV